MAASTEISEEGLGGPAVCCSFEVLPAATDKMMYNGVVGIKKRLQ
jgi:hypothetical protein